MVIEQLPLVDAPKKEEELVKAPTISIDEPVREEVHPISQEETPAARSQMQTEQLFEIIEQLEDLVEGLLEKQDLYKKQNNDLKEKLAAKVKEFSEKEEKMLLTYQEYVRRSGDLQNRFQSRVDGIVTKVKTFIDEAE